MAMLNNQMVIIHIFIQAWMDPFIVDAMPFKPRFSSWNGALGYPRTR